MRGPSGYIYLKGGSGIAVVEAASGSLVRTLPPGTPAPDWRWFYSVAGQQLKLVDPATGDQSHSSTAPAWADGVRTSPNGRWLVFTGQPAATSSVSHFQIQDSALAKPPVVVDLPGRFTFDGISNDGRSLFLLEWLAPGSYQVRRYDLGPRQLFGQVIAEKGETGPMSGVGKRSLSTRDGAFQVTLYEHKTGGESFLHELPLNAQEPFAACVDLPAPDSGWDLVASPDGDTFFAVNPAAGEIVPSRPAGSNGTVSQWRLPPLGAAASSAATVDASGSTIYLASGDRLAAFDTPRLAPAATVRLPAAISSLAMSPDGSVLYGLAQDRLLQLNPRSLRVETERPLPEVYQSIMRVA